MFIVALLSTASAQDLEPREELVRYAEKTEITFDELDVEGKVQGPSGELVNARPKLVTPPLFRVRTDFQPEMVASVDTVK